MTTEKLLDVADKGQSAAHLRTQLAPFVAEMEKIWLLNVISLYESGKPADEIMRLVGKLAATRELSNVLDTLVARGQKARRELDENGN